jgi:hypothetical protein
VSSLGSLWWPRWFPPDLRLPWPRQLAIHWRANLLMLRSPRAVTGFCAISFPPVAIPVAAALLGGWLSGEPRGLGSVAGLSLYAIVIAFYLLVQHLAFMIAIDRTYLPFVRDALRERGVPLCRRCGHRLLDGAPRCPECGQLPLPPLSAAASGGSAPHPTTLPAPIRDPAPPP